MRSTSPRLAAAAFQIFSLLPGCAYAVAGGSADDVQEFEVLLKRAQEHRAAGQTDQALDELRTLQASLRGHPEFSALALSVQRETAEAYLSRAGRSKDDLQRAAASFEAVVTEQPKDAFIRYKLGLVYRELGDNRRAASNLRAAVDGGFQNLGARINLIEAAFASGQSTLGLQASKEVITPALQSPGVLLRLGKLLFEHLFYKEALHAFQLAHQAAPAQFEPRFRMALTHYLLKEYPETVTALQAGANLDSNPEAASLAASAEAQSGQTDQAVLALRRAIGQSPQSPHPYINLALIELDRGNSAEAEKLLGRLRSLPQGIDAKVFYSVNRNSCRDLAGAIDRGEARAQPAADTSSAQNAEFYYQLAVQLQNRFHYASAVELIRLAQANEGSTTRVLFVAGTSCLNLDTQTPEPIRFLRAAIAQDPKSAPAYYFLGRAYSRQGDLAAALPAYREAARLHPDPAYLLSLGRTLARSGESDNDRAQAIAAYQEALQLDPSCAEAHLELGRVAYQTKSLEKARAELEKTIDLEPDFYEADYLLGRLFYEMGDRKQSKAYMQSFAEKKAAIAEQSVAGSGFIFGGQ